MKTADFDYELPEDLIAQEPARRREHARMLVVNRCDGTLEHRRFTDFPSYLDAGDLVVLNNTRVIPARVYGRKEGSGGKVELLLLEEVTPGTWEVLLRASRRPPIGSNILFGDGDAQATILDDKGEGRATLRIYADRPWLEILDEIGKPPLPPYIKRKGEAAGREEDRERYQTVYAEHPGAVAAPTAGLHFTHDVLGQLERMGVKRTEVTLHVGLGTFRPVTADRVEEHQMEEERYLVPEAAAAQIQDTRERGSRVVAIGSTSVRTLETVGGRNGMVYASQGRTNLFIYPTYTFRVVDAMLTNFHLPRSTLLMMVCAFGGEELMMRAYREAVRQRYRFYSYGDCMLIL